MAQDVETFVAELKAFNGKRAVTTSIRRHLQAATRQVTGTIRANAFSILPKRGGLAAWVAAARIRSSVRTSGRTTGVFLVGSRKSRRNKSDLAAINRGRVRHPSWGRRGPGQWHNQSVNPGWFTRPAADASFWRAAVEEAVDEAMDEIRRG